MNKDDVYVKQLQALEETIVNKLSNYHNLPQIDFNFTHYELFNKQLSQKCDFLKNEIDVLTKMVLDKEKDFERHMLSIIENEYDGDHFRKNSVFNAIRDEH